MIELNGELLRWQLGNGVTVRPRYGNRLHEIRVRQSEATEDILVKAEDYGDGEYFFEIPNILMERFGTISIEVISVDENGHKDYEKQTFLVRDSEKPYDYEYWENTNSGGGSGGGSGEVYWHDIKDKPFDRRSYTETIVEATELVLTKEPGTNIYTGIVKGNMSLDGVHYVDVGIGDESMWYTFYDKDESGRPYVTLHDWDIDGVTVVRTIIDNCDWDGDGWVFTVKFEFQSETDIETQQFVYNPFWITTEVDSISYLDSMYLPKADYVPEAVGETVTAEEFNALLSALRNAGYMRDE